MVLDRARYDAAWTIAREPNGVSLSFTLPGVGAVGHGTGRFIGDSLTVSATWSLAAKHCSGTLTLGGRSANEGVAIIGELEYVDGCSDGRTKPGTFAVWRAGHRVTRVRASGK